MQLDGLGIGADRHVEHHGGFHRIAWVQVRKRVVEIDPRLVVGLIDRDAVGLNPKTVEACTKRSDMPETRRKFDPEFRDGAVRIVAETAKSIAQVPGTWA